jgi:hypothetical protein
VNTHTLIDVTQTIGLIAMGVFLFTAIVRNALEGDLIWLGVWSFAGGIYSVIALIGLLVWLDLA